MNARASIRKNRFTPGSIALTGAILLVLTFAVDSMTDVGAAFAAEAAASEQASS